ncbi:uncharacterized protein LOC125031940 [Penaeus chinensis]|uniref:uncharacterized protein LOC125031940 n=1 Tax=Penaeus chinensis TaxID=139456 RepID=UPI001FB71E9C|nr:uncharacterized protein LOC125031940 [Penaeus chinensis]
MAFKASLVLLVLAAALSRAAEEAQKEAPKDSSRNLLNSETQTVSVGYSSFVSLVAVVVGALVVMALMTFLGRRDEAGGYEAPASYTQTSGPAAYEKVYSVLNSLKEAARKFQ